MQSVFITTVSLLVLLGSGFALNNVSISRTSNGGVFAPGDVVFQDEFDFINTAVWQYEINMNGGYNNEFQIYDRYSENAYVREGILYIRPSLSLDTVFGGNFEQLYNGYLGLEGCTDYPGSLDCERYASYPWIHPPVVSTRLRTKGTFSFTYGRIVARAKIPSGDWTWPAIWMLPESEKYGQWPRSGEIDIMESRGNRKLFSNDGQVNIGSEQVASTLHFGPSAATNNYWAGHGEYNSAPDQGYDRDFHIYECQWTPNNLLFLVDGNQIANVVPPGGGFFELGQFANDQPNPWVGAQNPRMAPFDENFHLILNVATGGGYFPPNSQPPPPWGETPFLDFFNIRDQWLSTWTGESQAMAVDYIRIYAI